jgi:hypothetical protein
MVGMISHFLTTPVTDDPEEQRIVLYDLMIGSMITNGRETMMRQVIESGSATHMLFVDDDMGWKPDILNTAISRDKDIVLANYRRKMHPWTFTARVSDGNGGDQECITNDAKNDLEPALFGGFGFCLMKVDKIAQIAEPRFDNQWIEIRKAFTTEDICFMDKARWYGLEVYVDHEISKKVWHVGDFVYRYTDQPVMDTAPQFEVNRFKL